jgi:hypothetical protein
MSSKVEVVVDVVEYGRLVEVILLFAGAFGSAWILRGEDASVERNARALILAAVAVLQVGGLAQLPPSGGWALWCVSGSMILTAGVLVSRKDRAR